VFCESIQGLLFSFVIMNSSETKNSAFLNSGPTQRIWYSLFLSLFAIVLAIFLVLKGQSLYFDTIQEQQTEQLANAIDRLLSEEYTAPCRQLSLQAEIIENASHRSQPDNPQVAELLKITKDILNASIVYVMDSNGTVTASSKTSTGKGLTGKNYKFRPYFTGAIKGEASRYAAVGVTTNRRGLYFSTPIFDTSDKPIGVVVIKSGIQRIQIELDEFPVQHIALLSDTGIVFVVSGTDKDWLYKAALPLSPTRKNALIASRQFANNPLTDLPISFQQTATHFDGVSYTIHKTPVALVGWNLVSFSKRPKRYPLILLVLLPGLLFTYLFISKSIVRNNERLLKQEMEAEILQRIAIQKELEIAKEAAEAANVAKSDFLANMSHEIRTPMNGIMGMTNMVLDSKLTEEQREQLEMVDSSAQRLLGLINSILDFSKIEAGKMELEEVPFSLNNILEEVFSLMAVKAQERRVVLSKHPLGSLPEMLIGDPDRLMQIFINLINNALKFTEDGSVKILVQCKESTQDTIILQFGVQDTGIGIHQEKQAAIFESFAQADSSTTRKYGGTGLGLSISSQLVQLLGGEIWVESEEDNGATFWFTAHFKLPETGLEERGVSQATLVKSGLSRQQILANCTLLLAEDEPVNMLLVTSILEKEGIRFTAVNNGQEAVDQFLSKPFDCILMDIQMPDMDGYQTTAAIRKHEKLSGGHIPIIAMTAHAMRGDRQKCLSAGMDGYITKPLHVEDLLAAIEQQLLRTVLIADDDPVSRRVTSRIFSDMGWQVTLAENGDQALYECDKSRFELILMDIQMRELDGMGGTQAIRRRDAVTGSHSLIVALTLLDAQDSEAFCLGAGMDGFIEKPVTEEKVNAQLTAFNIKVTP